MRNTSSSPASTRARAAERLPRSTWILFLCQAINLSAAVISVSIAPLAGLKLAPSAAWATVPYGIQFAAVALLTYPASQLMHRFGRRAGFLIGACLLILSGITGYAAVSRGSFVGVAIAHGFLGAYVSFANFYRFAAVDGLTPNNKPRGMALVVAGGAIAAVLGPFASIELQHVTGFAPFALCYGFFIFLGAITIALIYSWAPAKTTSQIQSVAVSQKVSRAALSLGMFSAAAAYLMMNMLMVQASLVMNSICVSFDDSTVAIQGHVLAMFLPSFVTGIAVAKLGNRIVLSVGAVLLVLASILGMYQPSYSALIVELVLLGLGWNLAYIGGGSLVAKNLSTRQGYRMQGINDAVIAIFATVGAFLPSVLQQSIGWRDTNMACLVLSGCALVATLIVLRRQSTSLIA